MCVCLSVKLLCQCCFQLEEKRRTHPRAKAPDHCRRKPSSADIIMAEVLLTFQLKDNTPGGSNQGIKGTRKKIVTGVVLHINLQMRNFMSTNLFIDL